MNRRKLLVAAALAGGGAVTAAGTTALAARRYLKREYGRPDPAAGDDLSSLPGVVHHHLPSYDGGTLHLLEHGPSDAQPLLFVHGVTLAADVWWYQLRDLAGSFRVIALDQRGHGQSVAGTAGYGLEHLGRDIAAVVEGLDLHGAIVIGHSMGGFATQQFCIDHPEILAERVAGIVLVNTSSGALLGPRGELVLPVAKRIVRAGGRRPKQANLDIAYLAARYTLGKDASPSHVRFTYQLADAMAPEAMVASITAFLDMDLREGLRSVDVPALVVTGSHDRLTPPRMARDIVGNLRGARLVILPGCGHMSMLERHRELDRLIADFAMYNKDVSSSGRTEVEPWVYGSA